MNHKTAKRVCMALFFAGLANFAAFVAVAIYLGGDALNGTVRDGHYYVSQHGKDTEVSAQTFFYSRAHAQSVFITHPLAILAAIVGSRIDKTAKQRST